MKEWWGHLGQLGASEGDVLRAVVQPADALLERQQALVDLGALERPILVLAVESVRAALGAGEVDEGEAADLLEGGRRLGRLLLCLLPVAAHQTPPLL